MIRFTVFSVLTLLAIDAGAAESVSFATCPPRAELEAAGTALAVGDRARAWLHLRRAEQIAAACERLSSPGDPVYVRALTRGAPSSKRRPTAPREGGAGSGG